MDIGKTNYGEYATIGGDGMKEAKICGVTIEYGPQRYRKDSEGNWSTLMWGTFGPSDNGIPRYAWQHIPTDRVPGEVIVEGGKR